MIWLIHYFRRVFCAHDWLVEEGRFISDGEFRRREGVKVYMRCKKCGYHTRHWKL